MDNWNTLNSTETNKMAADEEKGKTVIHDMMNNDEFKHFFKNLMREAVKEESQEYWERITTLEKQVFELNEEKDKMRGDIHELKNENEKLKEQNAAIKAQADTLQSEIEIRSMVLEDLQQYSRRNCVLLTGIPENKDEDTDKLVKDLCADKLSVPLDDTDIDRSHRVGKPKAGVRARPIIVKFTRYNRKAEIMKARRKLKGSNIGIQEQLTPFKQLLSEKARKLVKMSEIAKASWTWDGKVFVLVKPSDNAPEKKVIINRIEDLNSIWNQGLKALQDRKKVPVGKKLFAKTDFDSSDSDEN